ncbi:cytolysin Src-1-like [Stegastes partitus]|uniref:Cytolysin Src-1-like n=2 Tax=Stegastes partitus TaxID=144197 RepID=A0A9Y4NCE7_9TELE|nr:PREDICTED: cytolysin Src-1-like [Stegastes partitus]
MPAEFLPREPSATSTITGIMGNLLPTHRQCAVQINNNCTSYVLRNPRVYTDSGHCNEALTPTIGPSSDGHGLFMKTPYTARGAVGVFTYDLYNETTKRDDNKVAVMFSNPYDLNIYSNCFAVGIIDGNQPCDQSLYETMCYHTLEWFVRAQAGSYLTYSKGDVTISATMTDAYQVDLTVTVSSTVC